jgi:hypothetical protein
MSAALPDPSGIVKRVGMWRRIEIGAVASVVACLFVGIGFAQQISGDSPSKQDAKRNGKPETEHSQMTGMNQSQMEGMSHTTDSDRVEMLLMNQASGTSLNPQSWPMPMLMTKLGSWQGMFMGEAFLVDTQQSGPRGHDKLYSPNWFMAATEHRLGNGSFMVQLMFSLEPATITERRYPEQFQTGETAFGKPIRDAQHPHNLIMGLSFDYARPIAERTILQLYFAPVGDPALGPVAFPHRASAMELPQAPLGHHWQDSTHISDEVLTVGITQGVVRLEASGFYGSEPNENRWNIDSGTINSWSTRLSVLPTKNWVAQVSVGRLAHPERDQPGDVVRSTASVEYVRPLASKTSWATSLIWGRDHNTFTRRNTNAFLLESEFPIQRKNFLTGRFELVDKDELFSDQADLERRLDQTVGSTFRIGAYTLGYTRDIDLFRFVETGIGTNLTTYTLPDAIKPYYGNRPLAVNIYLRVRLRPR